MARKKRIVANKKIPVILMEAMKHLGQKFDVVEVRAIFARNVLLPKGHAILGNAANLHAYKIKIEKNQKDKDVFAKKITEGLKKLQEAEGITIVRKANDKGTLFDKMDASDLVNEIKTQMSIDLAPEYVLMKKKIEALGEYRVKISYHNVSEDIAVKVVSE